MCWEKQKDRACSDLQVAVEHEQLLTRIFHRVAAQVVDERGYSGRPAVPADAGDGELVATLVREEHLEAAAGMSCQLHHLTASGVEGGEGHVR